MLGEHRGEVTLGCRFCDELRPLIEGQLLAQYPDCRVTRLKEKGSGMPQHGYKSWSRDLRLRPDIFPIKRYQQFEDPLNRNVSDPLAALLTTLTRQENDQLEARIEIRFSTAQPRRIARARKCVRRLAGSFFLSHPRLARLYATLTSSPHLVYRMLAFAIAVLARRTA
jgi:hypothetical protein